jgi:hypothetical protein
MIAANDAPEDSLRPDDAAPRSSARRLRRAPLLWGIFGGVLAAIVGSFIYLLVTSDRAPRLTRESYEAAVARWDAHGPADYNLDIELTGNRPSLIHVEVRDGQAVHMTRDGVQPRQERTWFYWTVPGMFDTIAEELEMAENPAKAFGAPAATQVVSWAEFDPQLGYPRRYDRVVLGTDFEIHWKVTRFETISAGAGKSANTAGQASSGTPSP